MASQAVAEIYLQNSLSAEDINAARKALNSERTPKGKPVVEDNMNVWDMDRVINDAFERLNRPDITATVNWNPNGNPVYYILQQQTDLGSHFVLGDANKNVIFNPAPNIQPGRIVRYLPVYLHYSHRK